MLSDDLKCALCLVAILTIIGALFWWSNKRML